MIALTVFPVISLPVWTPCLCHAGNARAEVMVPVCAVIWGRILVGFILNERRWKIALYLILPIVLGLVTQVVFEHAN